MVGSLAERIKKLEAIVDLALDRLLELLQAPRQDPRRMLIAEMAMTQRAFKDVRGAGAEGGHALPVDEFMQTLEALQAEVATEKNRVWPRVADGTLALPHLKRLCKEYYFLGKWYTCEFGSIVSNAPDSQTKKTGYPPSAFEGE